MTLWRRLQVAGPVGTVCPDTLGGKPAMTTSAADQPIWSPTAAHIANSNVTAFMRYLERQGAGGPFADYESFAEWSRQNTEKFFVGLWDFAGIV